MRKSKFVNYLKYTQNEKSFFSPFKLAMVNSSAWCWQRLKIFSCKAGKREKNVIYLNLAKCMKMLTIWTPFDPSAMSRNLNQRNNQGGMPRLATRMHRIISDGKNFENKFKHETIDQ